MIPAGHTSVMAGRRSPPDVISLEQARERGQGWYYTGEACPQGHFAKRSVSNRECRGCVNDRARRYRAEDPERVRARERKALAARPQRFEQARAQYQKHREKRLAEDKARYQSNHKYRAAKIAQAAVWWKSNRGAVNYRTARRRAYIKQATPPWLTLEQKKLIRRHYLLASALPGEWHVDHIEPLRAKDACGLNVPWNLQIMPGDENRAKGNRRETL